MQCIGMSKEETQQYEFDRAERLRDAQRTGIYIDEFTTPLLTIEERLAFASAIFRQLPKCIVDKRRLEMEELNKARALATTNEPGELAIDLPAVEKGLQTIKAFQLLVRHNLVEEKDYGTIPGTQKPTLYKPGAEKVAKLMGLADSYEIMTEQEDYEKGFFVYKVKCRLTSINTGKLISEGVGLCNSKESKYRWRWVSKSGIPQGMDINSLVSRQFTGRRGAPYYKYRIDNDDIYSQVNTILKMAKKRALVDAALSAGRLSEIFTQDEEDMNGKIPSGNNQSNVKAAEFEDDYQLDKQKQPSETLPSGKPKPTPAQINRMSLIKDAMLEKAVNDAVLREKRELTVPERDALSDLVYKALGGWPSHAADVSTCVSLIQPSQFLWAEAEQETK